MTKLSDQLDAKRKTVRPTLTKWLETLDKDDLKLIEAAATDNDLSVSALTEFFKENGVATSKDTVAAWRRDHELTR